MRGLKCLLYFFLKKHDFYQFCHFKNLENTKLYLHAHNLVYMHMMSMMKYMHKIYVVLQVMVIPCNIPSISRLRRAPLMSQIMPHHLHCEINTQHFHHAEADEQIHLYMYFYLHLFLLLSPSPCHCSIPV